MFCKSLVTSFHFYFLTCFHFQTFLCLFFYLSWLHSITSLGRLVCPHSPLLFIPELSLLMSTASVTCLRVASLPNTSLTWYTNSCSSLSCSSLQCLQSTELSFLILYSYRCSFILAHADLPVSPMYLSLHALHTISYVTPSFLQSPFTLLVLHILHSSSSHSFQLN